MIFTAPCQTAAEERRASIVRRVASPRAVRHHLVCFGALLNFDQNLLLLPLQLRALPFEVAHRFVYHSLVLAELLCAVDAYQRRGIASAVRREIAYPAVSSSCRITTPFLKRHPRPEAKNTALGRQGPKKKRQKHDETPTTGLTLRVISGLTHALFPWMKDSLAILN